MHLLKVFEDKAFFCGNISAGELYYPSPSVPTEGTDEYGLSGHKSQ